MEGISRNANVAIGEEIDPSIEQPIGTETTALPSIQPTEDISPKSSYPFLSGRNLLWLVFLWPWVFIPICFALFYGYHSKYYYQLEGVNQVPTISVSGSKPPSSILFAYGLHFEAVLLSVFFILLYHLYHEKIDSYYNTDRVDDDAIDIEADSDAVDGYRPPESTLEPYPTSTSNVITSPPSALNTPPHISSNSDATENNQQAEDQRRQGEDTNGTRLLNCEGYYRYLINACECATCYGCKFFQCACCYCDYLAFDDHFQHTNPQRYPLLRSYLHHWNRICLGIGLFAAWCMTIVGSIDLGVNDTVHGIFALLMFIGGVAHEVFFFYHVTRHVGSVQRHSLFPVFCHQICLVITLPMNILLVIITGIIYLACGDQCDAFVFNMFPVLEFTTILFVLFYVLSFYDEFGRVALVTTVNHRWKNL